MGRVYSAVDVAQNCAASPGVTSIGLNSATTIRPSVTELILGTLGTAADNMLQWELRRFNTSVGTGTALSEQPIDPASPAALAAALGNHSAEPTYGSLAIPLKIGIHQRASFHWRAAANRGITIAAVATEGLGIVAFNATYTGLLSATMFWEE